MMVTRVWDWAVSVLQEDKALRPWQGNGLGDHRAAVQPQHASAWCKAQLVWGGLWDTVTGSGDDFIRDSADYRGVPKTNGPASLDLCISPQPS